MKILLNSHLATFRRNLLPPSSGQKSTPIIKIENSSGRPVNAYHTAKRKIREEHFEMKFEISSQRINELPYRARSFWKYRQRKV
jgi:hypothetical protein